MPPQGSPPLPIEPSQAQAAVLDVLENRAQTAPHELAGRADAGDQVLDFLARNGGVATRAAVAANIAAPPSANHFLSGDAEEGVRGELARKIARLLPGLGRQDMLNLRESCIKLLDKLARDQTPFVRAILAEEIKHLDCVPKPIVDRLARDVEEVVAAPILEYSPLLSDCDLIEIIAGAQIQGIIAAIARRRPLSENVSDAVVCSLDVPGLVSLLANQDAAIRADTLYQIADSAEKLTSLHELLVLRSDLSVRTVRRLASFVGSELLENLGRRDGLDERTRELLHRRLVKRLNEEELPPEADNSDPARPGWIPFDEEALERAIKLGEKQALIRALSALADAPPETIRRVLDSKSAGAAIALAWKAGLSMRLAYQIETQIMHLPPDECVPARRGRDFPYTDDEMACQLGIFDIPPPRKARSR
ncbi:MAG TPA: DUF2336 domain-containing protein [Rhizomicrobium sp.]|nr:DUF2336 domain-containing protein [Rhizomicrobium sp.]